jgi:hypothetical protein
MKTLICLLLFLASAFGQTAVNVTKIGGTAPTTAGKFDFKAADGDVFVRQATASNLHTAATLDAETTKVVGTVRIIGNAGANFDGATGAAVPANAVLMGGTDGTNTRAPYMDPCDYNAWTYYYINVSSNTQIAGLAGSSKNYYVCQLVILPVAAAANVNLVSSGTAGNACASTPTAFLTGGATAALGAQISINGGFVLPSSGHAWASTQATNHAICIFASAAVTGVLAYVGPL